MRCCEVKKNDVVDLFFDVDDYLRNVEWVIVDNKPCIVHKMHSFLFMVMCFEIKDKVYVRARYKGDYKPKYSNRGFEWFLSRHPLANELGSEYVHQNDEARADAIDAIAMMCDDLAPKENLYD